MGLTVQVPVIVPGKGTVGSDNQGFETALIVAFLATCIFGELNWLSCHSLAFESGWL